MGHLAHLGRVGRVGGVGGRLARAPELHLGVVSKNVHPHCPVFAVLVPYSFIGEVLQSYLKWQVKCVESAHRREGAT